MGLADDLDARHAEIAVDDLLSQLGDDERAALTRALCDIRHMRIDGRTYYRWSERDLSARLAEDGYRISHHKIRRWRQANVT